MLKLFTVLLLGFVMAGCSEPKSIGINVDKKAVSSGLAPKNYKVDEDKTIQVNSKVDEKNFGITIGDLSNRLNSASKKAELGDIPFNKFNVHKGPGNNTFSVEISPDLTMAGSFDKNGKVKSIALIMNPNENGGAEIMSMLLMVRLTTNSLSPNLHKEYTAGKMTEVILEAVDKYKDKGHGKASKIVDSVKYSVMVDSITGLWVTFDAV